MSSIAKTKRTRTAKDGPSAAHKKIINELLEREDAKPTGDAVRLAESNPRREFSRYQVPTDRGLKDIEIWGDRVKVRSEAVYGFGKKADDMDDMDGLPPTAHADEVVDAMPEDMEGMEDEMEEMGEEMPEGGLPLHIDVSVSVPDGMAEEEAISVLDEVLRDPELGEMINDRLSETGLSLFIIEVEPAGDDGDDDYDDEYMDAEHDDMSGIADEVIDPGEGDAREGYGY